LPELSQYAGGRQKLPWDHGPFPFGDGTAGRVTMRSAACSFTSQQQARHLTGQGRGGVVYGVAWGLRHLGTSVMPGKPGPGSPPHALCCLAQALRGLLTTSQFLFVSHLCLSCCLLVCCSALLCSKAPFHRWMGIFTLFYVP
jgi:hypothetical protein